MGPPRSGKTTSVIIPNVLTANSAVVVTSTKRDVFDQTWQFRRKTSPCYIFDPVQTTSLPKEVVSVGWSPVDAAGKFDKALLTAKSMVWAARPDGNKGDAQHWTQKSTELLATLLHAASISGVPFSEALSWLHRHEGGAALRILDSGGQNSEMAFDVLSGILNTDFREQSGIWSTVSSVCACYESSGAVLSTELPRVDYKNLLEQKSTVYIVAPGENQQLLAPVIAGFIGDIKRSVYMENLNYDLQRGKTNDAHFTKLLLVLDELANIAPLYDLPEIISEGGSQGVTTVACLQDLSQARRRWPVIADGFFSLFHTKFILPGLGDRQTLENISLLCGEKDEVIYSKTSHSKRTDKKLDSKTASIRKVKRMPPDAISRGNKGKALVIMGSVAGEVTLTPSYTLKNTLAKEVFSVRTKEGNPRKDSGLSVKVELTGTERKFIWSKNRRNVGQKSSFPVAEPKFEQLTILGEEKVKHQEQKSRILYRDKPGGSRTL